MPSALPLSRPGILRRVARGVKSRKGGVGHALKSARVLRNREALGRAVRSPETVRVFSNSRGGSTIFTEMLLDGRTAVLWEPMLTPEPPAGHEAAREAVGNLPYVPRGCEDEDLRALFVDMFDGRTQCRSTYPNPMPGLNQRGDRAIVKLCGGSACLPYLADLLPAATGRPLRAVHLVRHPAAVIASQMNFTHFDQFEPVRDTRSYQNGRYQDLFERYATAISDVRTREQMFAVWWCLFNVDALKTPAENRTWHTVCYEDLLTDPDGTAERLHAHLAGTETVGRPGPRLNLARLTQASATTVGGRASIDPTAQLGRWRKTLNARQIRDVLAVVEAFGIDLYGDDLLPIAR